MKNKSLTYIFRGLLSTEQKFIGHGTMHWNYKSYCTKYRHKCLFMYRLINQYSHLKYQIEKQTHFLNPGVELQVSAETTKIKIQYNNFIQTKTVSINGYSYQIGYFVWHTFSSFSHSDCSSWYPCFGCVPPYPPCLSKTKIRSKMRSRVYSKFLTENKKLFDQNI